MAVLVVEDEGLIQLDLMSQIEALGYTVHGATNADTAIALLEDHPNIRIICTDIDMPGTMNGLKLAHAVRDRWPPVKILITSGGQVPSELDMPQGAEFFPKPYRPEIIAQKCAKILGLV